MPSNRTYDKISVLIPTLNEENYIGECLDSVLCGDLPLAKLEILVIDGGSKDKTRQIVTNYSHRYPQIRLLDNPHTTVPFALNLGAKEAKGEILVWLGAHARYGRDYLSRSASLLIETGAASVGGRLTAHGEGNVGKAIALALSLPTGTGNAKYRSGNEPGWVDTVFGGCWWKSDFKRVGGFDSRWVVNQDAEFNYRLRKHIGNIYFSPEITCDYFVRSSISKLARQYFRYGIWRAKTVLRHPDSLRGRQLMPALFVVSLALTTLIAPWFALPLVSVLVLYSAALVLVLARVQNTGFLHKAIALFCTAILHLAWGSGFLIGLVSGQPARIELPPLS